MIPKIEDVEKPVVGSFYMVPCVYRGLWRPKYWPVIGPWHEDADLGVPNHHFHYDVRFFGGELWNHLTDQLRYQSRSHTAYVLGKVLSNPVGLGEEYPLFPRRMKMVREMPEFPSEEWHGGKSKIAMKLESEFKDVKMKCLTCPHRGMSLKGLPVGADGTVVCNGHGLKWNIKTGAMVPR